MTKQIHLIAVTAATERIYRSLLQEFEEQTGIRVNLQMVEWEKERAEFTSIALQRQHGDVLIVGAPVTYDLVGMNALRPFSAAEIANLGGADDFLPTRWKSGTLANDPQVWAVPWLVDFRVLYYWQDKLAAAGIDPASAFETAAQLENTIARLKERGSTLPWAIPVQRHTILHLVSSFIWAYGGDLLSPDGSKVVFHEPQALEGIRAYFRTLRYVSPDYLPLLEDPRLFTERRAAIIVGADWVFFGDFPKLLGCAPLPGGSYLGGTDVAIWSHTRNAQAAFELVRFLTGPALQLRIGSQYGMLSSRVSALHTLANQDSPVGAAQARAVLSGRTYPNVPMIGLIEDRLSTALLQCQQILLSNPNADDESMIKSNIIALGNRLNLSLGGA